MIDSLRHRTRSPGSVTMKLRFDPTNGDPRLTTAVERVAAASPSLGSLSNDSPCIRIPIGAVEPGLALAPTRMATPASQTPARCGTNRGAIGALPTIDDRPLRRHDGECRDRSGCVHPVWGPLVWSVSQPPPGRGGDQCGLAIAPAAPIRCDSVPP